MTGKLAKQETDMKTRRSFLLGCSALVALAAAPGVLAQPARPLLKVYKSPACGCCGDWEKHMRANGFRIETHAINDVAPIKRQYGVPEQLSSCHTATVDGYVVEGHVPAEDVKRLLRERPKAAGIAVPGMPIGSPGMEQGPPEPYSTIAFDGAKTWVYARH
jgi:hypothetical protein